MPNFVEINLMRPAPQLTTAAGDFPVTNDAAARLLVRLCVGVSVAGTIGPPLRNGGDVLRFADPDPGVARGADRAMHTALRYDEAQPLRVAGEIRRTLRTVLDRAGVRGLYPVGGDGDRLDLHGFELDVDLVSVGNGIAAATQGEPVDIPSIVAGHTALLQAYPVAEDGFTPGNLVWSHLEVVQEAISTLEREALIAVLRAAKMAPSAEASAAARRAGRRLLARGSADLDEEAILAYLASAIDRRDLEARWHQVERDLPTKPSPRLQMEKRRQDALRDPERFGPIALTTGHLCRMRDATPWVLGVEKAAVETADAQGHLQFISPGRLQSSLEAALKDALAVNTVTTIVLRGASGTGKSRLAYEVVRALAPAVWVISPRTAEFTAAVYDPSEHAALAVDPHEAVILWLDDVELHIGAELGDETRPGLTMAHLERLRDSGLTRPFIVLATAGGKGYRTHQEAGDRVELQRLGLEIDRFIKSADVLLPVSGLLPRETAAALLGQAAADEIATNGIGSYALRTEVLGALYLQGDWPTHLDRPTGDWREGQALADALLAWRVAVSDDPVDAEVARDLWKRFRGLRDLHGVASDSCWQAALVWATATPVAHQPLARVRPDGAFDVNDHLRDIANLALVVEHLFAQKDLQADFVPDPFQVGMRLHLVAPQIALGFYRSALEAGDWRASNNIGALMAHERPDDAIVYFEQAIDHGDARGHLNLGALLEPDNPIEARREYRRAAAAGEDAAFRLLARLVDADDPEQALNLLREGAERSDVDAMYEYGRRIIDQDVARARHFFGLAIEQGSARSMTALAASYLEDDRDKALELFERAGRMGDPLGYFAKANFLEQPGDEVTEVVRQAQLDMYREAAEGGVAEAMFNVAVMLADQDPDQSDAYYHRAVAEGHIGAMHNLGVRLGERDPERAIELLEAVIAADEPESAQAMASLADLLLDKDRDKAIRLLRHSAELGDARAMFNLGGLLIDESYEEAVRLLEAAAALQHTHAIVRLAHLLRDENAERAIALMTQAAELGNSNAQNNLAIMLEDRDPQGAEHWFQVAIENGSTAAMVNLGHRMARTDARQAIVLWEKAAAAGSAEAAEALADMTEWEEDEIPESTAMVSRAVELLED
ncbi:MAG TPA: tetratricopeptide repeat protein, partial [Solirubrobacteraceae bacterium]|nr:tetratricopeptide repeat protein [Solirubrobacteraceae bacterium]